MSTANPQGRAKAFLLSLLGISVLAGLTVTLLGIYGQNLFPQKDGNWKDPKLSYVKTPSLESLRADFTPDACFDNYDLEWTSGKDGQVYVNTAPFTVKGISWFGCEGHGYIFTGLNYTSMDTILNFFVQHKFNTVRIPVSVAFALAPKDTKPNPKFVSKDLRSLSIWEILDKAIEQCALRGLMVMLDMHTLGPMESTDLWYNEKYTEADILQAWSNIMEAYSAKWNVFAIDVKNEPNGIATWGVKNPATDVNKFYERAIQHIHNEFPNWKGLYLVEGVQFNKETDKPTDYPFWWGGNFGGAVNHPIQIPSYEVMNRVVYSPHVYGPDVYDHPYFKVPEAQLPAELDKVWDSQMGWLIPKLQHGMMIGEWGGNMRGKDLIVQQELAKWLVDNCMANNIWWAINPESGDTGGIMAWNWKTYDKRRLDLVDNMIPDPTRFGIRRSKLCIHLGTYPNPDCPMQPFQMPEIAQPQKLRVR